MKVALRMIFFAVVSTLASGSLAFAQTPEDNTLAAEDDDVTLDGPTEPTSAAKVEVPPPSPEMPPPPPPALEAAPAVNANPEPEVTSEDPKAAPSKEDAVAQEESDDDSDEETADEQQAAEPAVVATPNAKVEDKLTADRDDTPYSLDDSRHERIYGKRLFGSKRIQIAANKPSFTEQQKFYDKFYGKPAIYPTVSGDWFPWDFWVNPGITMGFGGYSVAGKTAKGASSADQVTEDNILVDEDSKTNLLFIPLRAGAKFEMTPFRRKWLVLDGWVGYEYGWWQETRSNSASISAWKLDTTTTTTKTNDPVLTSKGVKNAVVYGASANILLNWLDERSVRSMVDSMGISYVYLTPFFESVKTMNKQGLTFGRNVYGVGFTFESHR